MGLLDRFKKPRVVALAKNAEKDEETVTFEVTSGFREIYRGSPMYVKSIFPGTPVEAQVRFDNQPATVVFQDGKPPQEGQTFIVMAVSDS